MLPTITMTYEEVIRSTRDRLEFLVNELIVPIVNDDSIPKRAKEAILSDFYGLQLYMQSLCKACVALVEHGREVFDDEATN